MPPRVIELSPTKRLSQICHACGTLNPYLDELAKPIAACTSHCEGCGRAASTSPAREDDDASERNGSRGVTRG